MTENGTKHGSFSTSIVTIQFQQFLCVYIATEQACHGRYVISHATSIH